MAHFAEIKDGIVCQVIVVNNSEILDENGQEQESLGIAFCKSLYGADTEWVQTSYNNNFRGKFAGINEIWDGTNFVIPEAQSDGS
jgi:hypothetical protein